MRLYLALILVALLVILPIPAITVQLSLTEFQSRQRKVRIGYADIMIQTGSPVPDIVQQSAAVPQVLLP